VTDVRWGFSNIVKILKSVRDDRLRAYVVWLPIFGGDFRGEARKLSKSFPDKRVSYFLDPESLTGTMWERTLTTHREIAWDVYLLYGPEARWEGDTPEPPDLWRHRLDGVTNVPRFDEVEFRTILEKMINETPQLLRDKPILDRHSLLSR